ncbi:MAG: hypothetical protein AB8B59_04985 [Maribacter sp.]
MNFRFIIYLVLCSFQFVFSQRDSVLEIENVYQNYFELPRETIYLHLNKTKYLEGEKIWYTAYIYNRKTGLPFLETTNLICGIYDSNGTQILKELVFAENGIASGHFSLKSPIGSGDYCIKASTKYLKNFLDESPFIQKIEILGSQLSEENPIDIPTSYDMQLLPEAGHIVADVKNTIGFKITDQYGKGHLLTKVSLVDSKDRIILNNISSNRYGIGKFGYKHDIKETYFLKFKLPDGSLTSKQIPKAKEEGIAMTLNNLFEDKIAIELHTNSKTFTQLKKTDLYIAIHRDGLLTLDVFKLTDLEQSIYISKDKLLPGLNIITLFNADLKPISERLFFNQTYLKLGKVETIANEDRIFQDSVRIKLNLFSKNNTPANLSISILHEETVANEINRSIISDFLLKPYVKSGIEDVNYYFRNMNRKKRFELDMLLLTQGWSRYSWDNIFNKTPKVKYSFEQGVQFKGTVANAKNRRENTLVFYKSQMANTQLIKIDSSKNFIWQNSKVIKGDSISVSLTNEKGNTQIPELTNIAFSPTFSKDSLGINSVYGNENNFKPKKQLEKSTNLEMVYEDNTIALNNVTVTEVKIEKKLKHNASLTIGGAFKGIKITPRDVKTKPTLSHLITRMGFRVALDPEEHTSRILSRVPSRLPPQIYIDDQLVSRPGAREIDNIPDYFLNTPTDLIDEVYYEHNGMEDSDGGTIYIYRKYDGYVTDQLNNFTKMLVTEGFQRPEAYYNPKYSSYISNDFLKYGVVYWKDKLLTDESGSAELSFPNLGLKNLKLFIEGMSEDGTLFSDIKTVYLD